MKNNPVLQRKCFKCIRKERNIHEIQDLKAQMQDKNMVINELKKLILVTKGKSMETQFDKPSVVRKPNAQRIPKPSVLRKPTPFSNSPEMRSFQTKQSVNKTNVSDGLFKQVTQHNLPQNRKQSKYTRIKEKEAHLKLKAVPSSKGRANLLPRLDETPNFLKTFSRVQRNLQAQVIVSVLTEYRVLEQDTPCIFQREVALNIRLSTPLNPKPQCVFRKKNRTLVEAARTMPFSVCPKLTIIIWAEAVATMHGYTQNRSIIISTHLKTTAYHI
ncbi:hypothetical protein Tco_0506623 [Tanacetum coccineum]